MKSFSLNSAHDVEIVNNVVQLAEGAELKRQSAECNLNTKKGEWFLNTALGINMNAMLVRQSELSEDVVQSTILDGLYQVDETFAMHDLNIDYAKTTRKLTVGFKATTDDGESISISDVWN